MSYQFEDAAPVKIEGAGRRAEPNPFEDVVKSIALKTDEQGRPVGKSFGEAYDTRDEDGFKKLAAKIRRLLSEAGAKCEPKVTVRMSVAEVGKPEGDEQAIKVTFWTVPLQKRREVSTQTASTQASE